MPYATVLEARNVRCDKDSLIGPEYFLPIADRWLLRLGNLGNWKAVGEGVCEMKIDVGQGYRAYFVQRGKVIIVLLCGGNKSTQSKDIKLARKLASELED